VVCAAQQARTQLTGAPRWARARRRDLTDTLASCDSQLQQHPEQLAQLDTQISQVTRRLEQHDRAWNARQAADYRTPSWPAAVLDPLGQLTSPTLTRSAPNPPSTRPTLTSPSRSSTTEPYRPAPERGHGRSR